MESICICVFVYLYLYLCHLWALGQLASVKLCKVTSKSASLQLLLLLLLLLALEQLLLIEVTLLQLRGETFPDDVLQKVRLPKLRLSSLDKLLSVAMLSMMDREIYGRVYPQSLINVA